MGEADAQDGVQQCGFVHFVRNHGFTRARVATAAILGFQTGGFAWVFVYFLHFFVKKWQHAKNRGTKQKDPHE